MRNVPDFSGIILQVVQFSSRQDASFVALHVLGALAPRDHLPVAFDQRQAVTVLDAVIPARPRTAQQCRQEVEAVGATLVRHPLASKVPQRGQKVIWPTNASDVPFLTLAGHRRMNGTRVPPLKALYLPPRYGPAGL